MSSYISGMLLKFWIRRIWNRRMFTEEIFLSNHNKIYRTIIAPLPPNSLTEAEKCIVMAKGIFDDSIIHNSMSMNELPPLSMASIRISKTTQNQVFWLSLVESKLQSIYSIIQVSIGMPSKNDVLLSTRESPIQWDLWIYDDTVRTSI